MYKIRVVHRSEQTKDLLCLDKNLDPAIPILVKLRPGLRVKGSRKCC